MRRKRPAAEPTSASTVSPRRAESRGRVPQLLARQPAHALRDDEHPVRLDLRRPRQSDHADARHHHAAVRPARLHAHDPHGHERASREHRAYPRRPFDRPLGERRARRRHGRVRAGRAVAADHELRAAARRRAFRARSREDDDHAELHGRGSRDTSRTSSRAATRSASRTCRMHPTLQGADVRRLLEGRRRARRRPVNAAAAAAAPRRRRSPGGSFGSGSIERTPGFRGGLS